jgi:hypothetical protein
MNLPNIMLTKKSLNTTIQKKCQQMVSVDDTIGKALILHGEQFYFVCRIPIELFGFQDLH